MRYRLGNKTYWSLELRGSCLEYSISNLWSVLPTPATMELTTYYCELPVSLFTPFFNKTPCTRGISQFVQCGRVRNLDEGLSVATQYLHVSTILVVR